MKYLIVLLATCFLTTQLFASSKLSIKVSGNTSTQYLCVSNVGCINISQGRNKHLPLTPGDISYIFLAEGKNYRMYPQSLPNSCNVSVKDNQTLVVSGNVNRAGNNMRINGLRCSVI